MKIILFNQTPLWILDPDVGAVGGEGRLNTHYFEAAEGP